MCSAFAASVPLILRNLRRNSSTKQQKQRYDDDRRQSLLVRLGCDGRTQEWVPHLNFQESGPPLDFQEWALLLNSQSLRAVGPSAMIHW